MSDRADVKTSLSALADDVQSTRLAVDGSGRVWVRDDTPIAAPVVTAATSEANTLQTVSTPSTGPRRILFVTVAYSDTATQTGITVTINSAEGAAYDTIIHTGTADAEDSFFQPSGELILADGDTLDVTAPAGGATVTSSIAIYSQA